MVTLVDHLVFRVIWPLVDVAGVVQDGFPLFHQQVRITRISTIVGIVLNEAIPLNPCLHVSVILPSRLFSLCLPCGIHRSCVLLRLQISFHQATHHRMSVCSYTCDGHFRIKQGLETSQNQHIPFWQNCLVQSLGSIQTQLSVQSRHALGCRYNILHISLANRSVHLQWEQQSLVTEAVAPLSAALHPCVVHHWHQVLGLHFIIHGMATQL